MGDNPASYSTQSEGELLECSPAAGPGSQASPEAKGAVPGAVGGPGGKRNGKTPSGKLKRKLKRLKNEPKSVVGEGPSGVHVLDYVEARATELKTMQKALKHKGGGKRVFQTLPRHMRRRAMSHNPKRLPRRLREAAAKEMEADEVPAKRKKPPSRRQRRKVSTMRKEGFRTEREHVWLETHMWHVKRMKMVSRYGYRLADRCCDKSVRATYKSLRHGCVLSDLSYYVCNEVTGPQRAIMSCLSPLFHTDAGLTIKAKAYLGGQREGKANMYRFGAYPYGAVAPVQFLWQAPFPANPSSPAAASDSSKPSQQLERRVKLWIWCHPAAQKAVLAELQAAVTAYNRASPERSSSTDYPSRFSSPSPPDEVSVTVRKLLRFCLSGPRSHALLMETLKPVWRDGIFPSDHDAGLEEGAEGEEGASEYEDDSDDSGMDEKIPPAPTVQKWWLGEHKARLATHSEVLAREYPSIKAAAQSASFSRGAVLGMCVQDPRLFTPSVVTDMVSAYYPQKSKGLLFEGDDVGLESDSDEENDDSDDPVVPEMSPTPDIEQPPPVLPTLPPELAFSPIWDAAVCSSVSKSVASDCYLNRKRSKKLVRPSHLSLGDSAPQIPVLLIQQSAPSSSSYAPSSHTPLGAGWDLVLPPEWGVPFLVSLYYRGARVVGMKGLQKCSLETLSPHFPHDFPDTSAGSLHNTDQRKELEVRYTKRPPDKRPNFGRLCVPNPFHCPWENLVETWIRNHKSGWDDACRVGIKRLAEHTQQGSISKIIKLDGLEHAESCVAEPVEGERGGIDYISNNAYAARAGDSQSFYVVRSRDDLNSLRVFIEGTVNNSTKRSSRFSMSDAIQRCSIDYLLEKHVNSLVAVKLEAHGAGRSFAPLSTISLPQLSDLRSLLDSGPSCPFTGPSERIDKRGMTIMWNEKVVVGTSSLCKKERKAIVKKKNADNSTTVVSDFPLRPVKPSRQTVGYITSAGHRLTTSLRSGLGFVTLAGLVEVVKCCHAAGVPTLLALSRSASTDYSFIKLQIL